MAGEAEWDLRIDSRQPDAHRILCTAIVRLIEPEPPRPISILCIGTDRSTGDALGPLVGSELKRLHLPEVSVVGDLERPLHAANMASQLADLENQHPSSFKIAVDACLGRHDHVGSVAVGRGPLRPGAGVHKSLPPVGDLYVTGTVNVSGFMEYLVLQNTRLNLVISMAGVIARGLHSAMVSLRSSAAVNKPWRRFVRSSPES